MVENVVEELAARGVLEDDADVLFSLDHLVKTDDVRMGDLAKDGDLAVNLCEASWVASDAVATDKFDGDLLAISYCINLVLGA